MQIQGWINYHHLFYFKTIAEEESVSKAARKLRLGQPTLSAQLKVFEDILGVQLFQREHKRLILTEAGRVALDYARQIFKLGGEMVEVLQDQVVPSRINLQIGTLDSIAKQITLQLVKAAYKIAPCSITLLEGKPDVLMRELAGHRLDLVVTSFIPSAESSKGMFHRALVKKPVFVYGSPAFKNLRTDFPNSLQGQRFILPTFDSKLRQDFEHWRQVHGLNFDIVAETQDITLKKLMAVNGIGLIPASTYTVARQVRDGELIEIGKLDGTTEELFLISAQRRIPNPIASRLMNSFNYRSTE